MDYEWNGIKNNTNQGIHGVCFEEVYNFEWDSALVKADNRKNYGEDRFIAYGVIEERLCVLVFTLRGKVIRVISLRKANPREVSNYEQG